MERAVASPAGRPDFEPVTAESAACEAAPLFAMRDWAAVAFVVLLEIEAGFDVRFD